MKNLDRAWVWAILAAGWMGLIYALSDRPSNAYEGADKTTHQYCGLAAFSKYSANKYNGKDSQSSINTCQDHELYHEYSCVHHAAWYRCTML